MDFGYHHPQRIRAFPGADVDERLLFGHRLADLHLRIDPTFDWRFLLIAFKFRLVSKDLQLAGINVRQVLGALQLDPHQENRGDGIVRHQLDALPLLGIIEWLTLGVDQREPVFLWFWLHGS